MKLRKAKVIVEGWIDSDGVVYASDHEAREIALIRITDAESCANGKIKIEYVPEPFEPKIFHTYRYQDRPENYMWYNKKGYLVFYANRGYVRSGYSDDLIMTNASDWKDVTDAGT